MPKRIFIAFEKNALAMCNEDRQVKRLKFDHMNPINNVPFFHYLWDDNCHLTEIKKFIKTEFFISGFFKALFLIVLQEDISGIETRSITDLFMATGLCKKVIFTTEKVAMLSKNKPTRDYIALTKNERNLTINCFVEGKLVHSQYLDANFQDLEFIQNKIKSLTPPNTKLDVFSHGEDMSYYKSVGKLVTTEEMLSNFIDIDDYIRTNNR